MARISNAFRTHDARGNREDLSDAIYNIDPFDTPFVSMIGRRNVTNVNFDWQTENLKDVDRDNAAEEGFEVERVTSQPTVRQSNTVQISTKNATVTGSQEAANAAGKRSEMAHQMAMRGKELRRDIEAIALSNQQRVTGEDGVSVRRTRALEAWLATNAFRADDGSSSTGQGSAATDGTQRELTEEMVQEAMQSCFRNGAAPTTLMVGPYNKGVVSTFIGRETTRQNVDKERVQATVTLYASDFGDLTVVPNRWQRDRTAFLLDRGYARIGYYRNFMTKPIAKIGDAETKMMLAEWGLQIDNEAAHGVIADLVDSSAGVIA